MTKILIISGAGLSAESGIPTFRDSNGLWENHNVDEVANYTTWRNNFDLVHKFYNQRRLTLSSVSPNKAHTYYAELANKYTVLHLTQNIDNLLEKANHPKETLIHLHGFLTQLKCELCENIWDIDMAEYDTKGGCPSCKSTEDVKPNVVFFNEFAPNYEYLYRAIGSLTEEDILIVVGTSGSVIAINSLFHKVKCFKILNNLEKNWRIDDSIFNEVFYEPASSAVDKISEVVERIMV